MGYHDRYIEKGAGPAVVFSHGTLMDATMFDPQLDHLAERGYRAIAYNSRVLTGEPATHMLGDLVEDCRALLDDLGIQKCVLAGMSVGGFMALEFALAYPGAFERADPHRRHLEGLYGRGAGGLSPPIRQAGHRRHGTARLCRVGGALLLRRDDAQAQPGTRGELGRPLGDDGAGARGALPGPLLARQGRHHRAARGRARAGPRDPWRGGRAAPHRTRGRRWRMRSPTRPSRGLHTPAIR